MRSLRRTLVVAITVIGTTLATLGYAPPARASVEHVLNGSFETGTTYDWAEVGQTGGDGSPGSVYVNSDASHDDDAGLDYSVVLYPNPTGPAHVAVHQDLEPGKIVGQTLTVTGWLMSSHYNDGLKLKGRVEYAVGGGSTSGGTWNTTNCASGDIATTAAITWQSFSFTCASALPSGATAQVWAPKLVLETTGTATSGHVLRVDQASIQVPGTEPSLTHTENTVTLGSVNTARQTTMVSNRHGTNGVEGFPNTEVYTQDLDGTDATRITNNGYGHVHTAVNPVDRNQLVVARYDEDWNNDSSFDEVVDPQVLWVLDTTTGKEWQLLPTFSPSGLGGVDWTPDGRWIVFGMDTGRHWWVYKIKPDGTGLTRLTNDADSATCYESDIAVLNNGDEAIYRRGTRLSDGSCRNRGDLMKVSLASNPATAVAIWVPSVEGLSNGWAKGVFDPEPSPDDSKIVFTYNNTGFDTATINYNGTGLTTILDDADNGGSCDTACKVRYVPDWNWNTGSWNADSEGLISHYEKASGSITYQGLGSYDIADGTPYTQEESIGTVPPNDIATATDGARWSKFMVGGRNSPTNTTSCTNGFANGLDADEDDDVYASAVSSTATNVGDCQSWSVYGFQIPTGATIDGIEVRIQWKADASGGTPYLEANLTWNAGTNWTATKTTGGGSSVERRDTLGSPTDTWGHSWTVSELANANFGAVLTAECINDTTCGSWPYRDFYVDWVAVRVFWH